MSFFLAFFLAGSASAYEMGSAPFCIMDNMGNLKCFYYTLGACQDAVKSEMGPAACVKK